MQYQEDEDDVVVGRIGGAEDRRKEDEIGVISNMHVDLADNIFIRDSSRILVVTVHRLLAINVDKGDIMLPNVHNVNKVHEGVHKLHEDAPGGVDLAGLF